MTDPESSPSCCPGWSGPRSGVAGQGAGHPGPQGGRGGAGGRRPGRAGAGRRAAGAPRPALRLRRARHDGRRRGPRRPGQGALRRPGRRRVRRGPRRDLRPRGPAGPAASGGQRRAGARARRSRRSPPTLAERYAGTRVRRAAPRGPGPARHHREGAVAARRPGAARRRRRRGRLGATTSPARPSCATSPTAAAPRAVWAAAPATDWPLLLAHAVAATYAAGRGALVCVPDGKDVARVDRALTAVLGEGHHVTLTADAGPARRYRDFLAVSRGARRIVVGTRAASFAPVHDLGLVAIWDDGDDLHAEPRAPYPHTRETLLLRAEREGAAALVGGFARTVEAEYLLRTGWARELAPPRAARAPGDRRGRRREPVRPRRARPRGADPARGPRRDPRRPRARARCSCRRRGSGYAASLACERCRTPARCARLPGPAGADRPDDAAGLPLVRRRRRGLGLRGVRPPRAARPGARRRAHRRGARPRLPGRHRAHRRGDRVLADASTPSRRSWSRPPAPSRSPRAATPPSCSSTPGCCWRASTCAPTRRRCAAGQRRRAGRGPAGGWSRSATPPTRRCRRWCAGTWPASPPGRPPSGSRRTCRRRAGWPRSPASPAPSTTR